MLLKPVPMLLNRADFNMASGLEFPVSIVNKGWDEPLFSFWTGRHEIIALLRVAVDGSHVDDALDHKAICPFFSGLHKA